MAESRMPGADRGALVTIEIDGERLDAHVGETVAMALFAADRLVIRASSRLAAPRGIYCNMGICYECLVYLDGRAVRGCMVPVEDGMSLRTWRPEEATRSEEDRNDVEPDA